MLYGETPYFPLTVTSIDQTYATKSKTNPNPNE